MRVLLVEMRKPGLCSGLQFDGGCNRLGGLRRSY